MQIQDFADIIADTYNIRITDLALLERALTHRSYLGEDHSRISNERLEFLGDSVIGIVMAEYLYEEYPHRPEGELSKAKAVAVSEPELAEAAEKIKLPDFIIMSAGERHSGGAKRPSIISDAFEALVAVIYLNCGMEAAEKFVLGSLKEILGKIERNEYLCDFKTKLQEYIQGRFKSTPRYRVTGEVGADHDKTFIVEVTFAGEVLAEGSGKSKKAAEQDAAKKALAIYETREQNKE